MVEKGKVVEIQPDGRVVVEVNRQEACGSCSARAACNPTGADKTHRAIASCDIPVKVGDTVEIEIADGAMARAVLWAYLVPCALMISALFATWFGLKGTGLDREKDIIAAFGGLAGVGLGLIAMRIINNRIRKPGTKANRRFTIRVTCVVPDVRPCVTEGGPVS